MQRGGGEEDEWKAGGRRREAGFFTTELISVAAIKRGQKALSRSTGWGGGGGEEEEDGYFLSCPAYFLSCASTMCGEHAVAQHRHHMEVKYLWWLWCRRRDEALDSCFFWVASLAAINLFFEIVIWEENWHLDQLGAISALRIQQWPSWSEAVVADLFM